MELEKILSNILSKVSIRYCGIKLTSWETNWCSKTW